MRLAPASQDAAWDYSRTPPRTQAKSAKKPGNTGVSRYRYFWSFLVRGELLIEQSHRFDSTEIILEGDVLVRRMRVFVGKPKAH